MPYIEKEDREKIDKPLNELIFHLSVHKFPVGMLNYTFTKILWTYFKRNRCYNTINDILGVIEGVKAEFLRRRARHYEEEKILENGDIEV